MEGRNGGAEYHEKANYGAFIFVAFLLLVLSSCAHHISTQVPIDSDGDGVFDNFDYRYDLHFKETPIADAVPG
jgi:hypothetical protein